CETLHRSFYSHLYEAVFLRNKHRIVIRKLSPAVIMHEMAHALEKEAGLDLKEEFVLRCKEDLARYGRRGNPLLTHTIQRIMLEELRGYTEEKRLSELFARYYQLLAAGREMEQGQAFTYHDVKRFFEKTTEWIQERVIPAVKPLIRKEIEKASKALVA